RYTAQYDVTDIYGESASKKIEYEILENHAPEVRKSIDNMIFEQTAQKLAINMDDYITDPDGEPLVYSLNISDKAVVHINQVDNLLNLTTLDYGLANIVVTAADARGKTCELSFKVLVRDPAADPDIILDKSGILTVHDGTMKSLEVTVVNAGGAVLNSIKANGDAFNPITVDMSSYAPGRYGVTVVSEGKTTYKTIVKP
ncbi:MAG: hypothetical protein Q4G10_09840, partial [Bacteroidia bacterium]|nr:hypothetical protein [Bacteroidia bacterium]